MQCHVQRRQLQRDLRGGRNRDVHRYRLQRAVMLTRLGALILAATALTACGSDDATTNQPSNGKCAVDTSYNPPFDPAKFVDGVDNPLFPLKPGTKLAYEAGEETIEIEVLSEQKTIQGVACTVVH